MFIVDNVLYLYYLRTDLLVGFKDRNNMKAITNRTITNFITDLEVSKDTRLF